MSGEFELIAALRSRIEAVGAAESEALVLGSGDDAAITLPAGAAATSVDALVEGVHFEIPPFQPREVGHKALATALSDLAAMGAAAGEAYVQLGIPSGRTGDELLALADGLAALAARTGTAVAGGDVTASPALFVAVTAVGYAAAADALVRRFGATPGDIVVVTGELGGAAAGLALSECPELGGGLDRELVEGLHRRQRAPEPRLDAGAALARAGATAMIDLSDGLVADARHMAAASSVAIDLDALALPVQDGVARLATATGVEPAAFAAAGGEDYELLAALAPERLDSAREAVGAAGVALTAIGTVVAGEGVRLSGVADPPAGGFDHLARR